MTPTRFVVSIGCALFLGLAFWLGLRITDTGRSVKALDFETCERLGGVIEGELNQVCHYEGDSFEEPIVRKNLDRLIQLQSPSRDAVIKSPLVVSGSARREFIDGGRIQIELYDSQKTLLATGTARFAQSTTSPLLDWNGFRTRLFFETGNATGTLVMRGSRIENFPPQAEYLIRFTPLRATQAKAQSGMCIRAGCGGELCVSSDLSTQATSCTTQVQNKCLEHAACRMQENGECGWSKAPGAGQCKSD